MQERQRSLTQVKRSRLVKTARKQPLLGPMQAQGGLEVGFWYPRAILADIDDQSIVLCDGPDSEVFARLCLGQVTLPEEDPLQRGIVTGVGAGLPGRRKEDLHAAR